VLEFAVFVVSKSCISAAISCQVCDQKISVINTFGNSELSNPQKEEQQRG
jgi:hypothetical protein